MQQNSLGKGFVDVFNKNKQKEEQAVSPVSLPQENLSTKTGINKKKTTQLQQNMLNLLSIPQQGMAQQGV